MLASLSGYFFLLFLNTCICMGSNDAQFFLNFFAYIQPLDKFFYGASVIAWLVRVNAFNASYGCGYASRRRIV